MEITGQYSMTPKELRRGLWAIAPGRQTVMYALYFVGVFAGGTSGFQHFDVATVVIVLVLLGVFWFVLRRAQGKQLARLAVPTTLTLTDETATIALPEASVTHRWEGFLKLRSVEDFWLFYTTPRCAVIIPKRAFDAGQREQVEAFVRAEATPAGGRPASV